MACFPEKGRVKKGKEEEIGKKREKLGGKIIFKALSLCILCGGGA